MFGGERSQWYKFLYYVKYQQFYLAIATLEKNVPIQEEDPVFRFSASPFCGPLARKALSDHVQQRVHVLII